MKQQTKRHCVNCRREISPEDHYCPYCYAYQPVSRGERKSGAPKLLPGLLIAIIVLGAGGIFAWRMLGNSRNRSEAEAKAAATTSVTAAVTESATDTVSLEFPDPPTAAPSPAPTGTAVPEYRPVIRTREDLREALSYMRENDCLTVRPEEFTLTDAEVEEVLKDCNVAGAFINSNSSGSTIEIELYPGDGIASAVKNGKEDQLTPNWKSILNRARDVLDQILTPGMTDYEKELAIHDYIVYHCSYLIDEAQETDTTVGFWEHGRCQCSGYVDTFTLLCGLAGLETENIGGTILADGTGHAWNLIRLDGLWYAVDCTWDDPDTGEEDPVSGSECRWYFNIPQALFRETREWNYEPDGEYATAYDTNSWYGHNGFIASDTEEAAATVGAQLENGDTADVLYLGGEPDAVGIWRAGAFSRYGCSHNSKEIAGGVWCVRYTINR